MVGIKFFVPVELGEEWIKFLKSQDQDNPEVNICLEINEDQLARNKEKDDLWGFYWLPKASVEEWITTEYFKEVTRRK